MKGEFDNEVSIARKVITSLRSKDKKNTKELEAIIDLNYFVLIYTTSYPETCSGKEILQQIRSGQYD